MLMRHASFSTLADPAGALAIRRFWSHLYGLESFGGRRILEIGGSASINLEGFFSRHGADYSNVRLEGNPEGNPRVIVGDFMSIRGGYDLVISLGVFERGALDIDRESMIAGPIRHASGEIARKLSSLTAPGGFCVIGTIQSPCFLSDRLIRACGLSVRHRRSPFYTFMHAGNRGLYSDDDRSELLLLEKPSRLQKKME